MTRLLLSLLLLMFSCVFTLPSHAGKMADPNYNWVFTDDHGEHRDYASEWWYMTGHLATNEKIPHEFGYEATLFRAQRPLTATVSPETSKWISPQIYLIHVALTDVTGKKFYYTSSYDRDNPYQPVVSVHPWALKTRALEVEQSRVMRLGDPVWDLRVYDDDFNLDLRLLPQKEKVFHGTDKGYSKKGNCPSCASMYYSYTKIYTSGEVTLKDKNNPKKSKTLKVTGKSWFDHEFGSSQLTEKQQGWDWFAIQLDNGRELMVYRMREKDGKISPESGGTLILKTGDAIHLKRDDIVVEPLAYWTSPQSKTKYPSGWKIKVPKYKLDVTVKPKMKEQELYFKDSPNLSYWEGANSVEGTHDDKPVKGNAYVELAGYNGKLKF